MPKYECARCHKIFKQKQDYERHKNRKVPCEEVEEEKKEPKMVWMSIAGKSYYVKDKTEEEKDQAVEVLDGETIEEAHLRFWGVKK
jgi:hypothetical protein